MKDLTLPPDTEEASVVTALLTNALLQYWNARRGHTHSCLVVWQSASDVEAQRKGLECSPHCEMTRQALKRAGALAEEWKSGVLVT
jgi:hypothetical protein